MNPQTLTPPCTSPHPSHLSPLASHSPSFTRTTTNSPGSHLLHPAAPLCDAIAASESFDAPPVNPRDLLDELIAIAQSVVSGNMGHPETMLVAQATALNIMFSRLSERAMRSHNLAFANPMLRLAFRAQAQCSRALQTLTSMRYPAIFARQLNIAHQQVVTNASPHPPSAPPLPPPSASLNPAPTPSPVHAPLHLNPKPVQGLSTAPMAPPSPSSEPRNSPLPTHTPSTHNTPNLVRFQKSPPPTLVDVREPAASLGSSSQSSPPVPGGRSLPSFHIDAQPSATLMSPLSQPPANSPAQLPPPSA